MRLTKSLRALFAVCCAAALGSAIEMDLLYKNSATTNRVYLGTDTRSQCLFIGCALAVGLVLFTKRHTRGPPGPGGAVDAQARPGPQPVRLLGGLGGLAAAIAIWVATSTTSAFPYKGGFFLIGLATAGVILAAVGAPKSPVPRLLSLAPIRYIGPDLLRPLHLALAPVHLAGPRPHRAVGLRPLRPARRRHLRGVGGLVPPDRAAHPHGHLLQPVAGLRGRARRRRRGAGRHGRGHDGNDGRGQHGAARRTSTRDDGASTTHHGAGRHGDGPPVRVLLFGDSVAERWARVWARFRPRTSTTTSSPTMPSWAVGWSTGPRSSSWARWTRRPACSGPPAPTDDPNLVTPWATQWTQDRAVHPNVVVVGAGRWEVVDRLYQGKWTNILKPPFAAYVKHSSRRRPTW